MQKKEGWNANPLKTEMSYLDLAVTPVPPSVFNHYAYDFTLFAIRSKRWVVGVKRNEFKDVLSGVIDTFCPVFLESALNFRAFDSLSYYEIAR